MTRFFAALHVGAVLALAVTAILIFRLRCESFGCMGIGVAWFAWAAAFGVVLVMGTLVRASAASVGGLRTMARTALWTQAALGTALLVTWLGRQAP